MAGSSPMFVSLPDDVVTELVEKHLHVSDLLLLCRTCTYFRSVVDERLSASEISLAGAVVTDRFLTWLLRRRLPEGKLKSLDLTGCEHLSRAGVIRALRNGNTYSLESLTAHHLGGSSWTTDELRRLITACPSLRELHADCRTKGVGADQLKALLVKNSPILPRRLVLQRASVQTVQPQEAGLEIAVPVETLLQPALAPPPAAPPATGEAPVAEDQALLAAVPAEAVEVSAAGTAEEAEEAAVASRAAAFGEALIKCKSTLQELDVRGGMLDDAGLAQVSRLMKASGNELKRLLLPGANSLTEPARMRLFSLALARSERLELLQLGCSSINSEGGKAIATALHENRSLRQLELQHNPILDAGATALGHALVVNRSLETLDVPFTGLGDACCAALAHALRRGSSLIKLDLAGNRLTDVGAAELAAALPSSAHLKTLILTANPIGARGALALAAALPDVAPLRVLRLDGCCIGASPCGRLASSLARSAVCTLDLSNNEINDQGAWELAWRLPECANLHELRLASNEIEEDGASELLVALNTSPHLTKLDLRGNRLVEKESTAQALKATERCNVAFQLTPRARWVERAEEV